MQSKVSASLRVAYFESVTVYSILRFVFDAVLAYNSANKLATYRPTLEVWTVKYGSLDRPYLINLG